MAERIPKIGKDGKHRLDCPRCGKLLVRHDDDARGRFQFQCTRPSCKEKLEIFFNEAMPVWE